MSCVRPLVPEDISQVIDLYATVFPPSVSSEGLRSTFGEIFFGHPWRDDSLPSLVYQDDTRRIVGCLGVMPRRMSMNGRPIQAAISHTFMVERGSRSTPAAVELVKRFLSGPQDLSVAQGSSKAGRRIVEGFGGSTSLLYGIRWTRPLRPGRYGLGLLKRHGFPAACAHALRPLCFAMDAIAPLIGRKPFRLAEPRLAGEELDPEAWHEGVAAASARRSLRPEYDADSLKWLLARLAQNTGPGSFQKVLLRDSSRQIAGWYLYYLKPGAISEVVQVAATRDSMNEVLEHLFYHARREGAVAVSGQLDVTALEAFSEECCVLRHDGGPGLLIHSKHPDVLNAVHRGDAFIGRLEAEWWIAWLLNN